LERRLATALAALRELVSRRQGKKQLFHAELMGAAEGIVKREGVEGLLRYSVQAMTRAIKKRAYRGRAAPEEKEVFFEIEVPRDEGAIEQKKREMGWQVYGTNGLGMSAAQVVWA
jgi:hypothetical protein